MAVTPPPETCAQLLLLAGSRRSWMPRRTCHLTFVNAAVVSRDTVCEVDLEEIGAFLTTSPGHRLLLPIFSVTRTPARNISVLGPDGQSLPHLTRDEERKITANGLVKANGAPAVFTATDIAEVAHVLFAIDPSYGYPKPPNHPEWRQRLLNSNPGLDRFIEQAAKERIVFALPPESVAEWPFTITERHVEGLQNVRRSSAMVARRVRKKSRDPRGASTYAAWRFAPASVPGGVSREVEIRSLVCSDGSVMNVSPSQNKTADKVFHGIWSWAWWVPDTYVLNYPITDHLECGSYHIELECPSGVYISSANLRVLNKGVHENELIVVGDDDPHPDRAHLHFTRRLSKRDAPDGEYDVAALRVVLRPTYHNGLRTGALLSFVASVTLWTLFATIGWSQAGYSCWVCVLHINTINNSAVVSLMILAPSVAIGLVARQEEHDLTKRIHGRLRMRLALVSFTLFIAALLTALQPEGAALYWVLLVAAILATIPGIFTVVSAVVSRRQIRRITRGIRREQRWL